MFLDTERLLKSLRFWKVRATPQVCEPCRMHVTDVLPEVEHPPGVRRVKPGHQVEHRGLAGAVGTDDAHRFVLIHAKGKLVDGNHAAEALPEVVNFERLHSVVSIPRNLDSRLEMRP
jgi:hypothetical protein